MYAGFIYLFPSGVVIREINAPLCAGRHVHCNPEGTMFPQGYIGCVSQRTGQHLYNIIVYDRPQSAPYTDHVL